MSRLALLLCLAAFAGGFGFLAAVWGAQGHFSAASLGLFIAALAALVGAEVWRGES